MNLLILEAIILRTPEGIGESLADIAGVAQLCKRLYKLLVMKPKPTAAGPPRFVAGFAHGDGCGASPTARQFLKT